MATVVAAAAIVVITTCPRRRGAPSVGLHATAFAASSSEGESNANVVEADAEEMVASSDACKGCGKAQVQLGCDGLGRIRGGLASIPGMGWWPLKAYRPCPAFMENGGRYKRQGQSLEELAYGRSDSEEAAKKKKLAKKKNKR